MLPVINVSDKCFCRLVTLTSIQIRQNVEYADNWQDPPVKLRVVIIQTISHSRVSKAYLLSNNGLSCLGDIDLKLWFRGRITLDVMTTSELLHVRRF